MKRWSRLLKMGVEVAVGLLLALGMVSSAGAITNGQPDGNSHPYVGLLVFDSAPGVPAWRCSGSLIAPTVVLTAGHCTDGAVAVRVWFDEKVTDLTYPYGGKGSGAIEGTPYTHPDYNSSDNPYGGGNGLPAFTYRDVGIVVLSQQPDIGTKSHAQLPPPRLVDSLKNKTSVDMVGYGVQSQEHGGGPPVWEGERVRLYAYGELISGRFVHGAEFLRLTANPGGGSGGTCFGDSGGPNFLGGTATILGVTSYGTNMNCAGVGYASRIDIPEVLNWINSFPK